MKKTKKDKRRERQLSRAESGALYGMLRGLNRELNRPQIVRVDMERNVLQAKAAVTVEDMHIPTSYLKEQLCEELVRTLMKEDVVRFDMDDRGYGQKLLIGSLAVLMPRSYGGRFNR